MTKTYFYTNEDLSELNIIKTDLILSLFQSVDKRYCIERALKEAFLLGRKSKGVKK